MKSGEDSRKTALAPALRLRPLLKWSFIYLLWYTGLMAFARRWVRTNGAVVLTFHRVLSKEDTACTCSPEGLVTSQATFEHLLRYVKERYAVLDLANGVPSGSTRDIQVALTFDDGWEDNASTAFPIAVKLKLPFTIFVCPELLGKSIPFWPELVVALIRSVDAADEAMKCARQTLASTGHPDWAEALVNDKGDRSDKLIEEMKSLPDEDRNSLLHSLLSCGAFSGGRPNEGVDRTMSWSQLIQLHRCGIGFGSHTQRHAILTRIPQALAEWEVRESKAALEERLGSCSLFSYPNGDVSPAVRDIVARAGYKMAFANSPGVWRGDCDPLLIPRINLSEGTLTGLDGRFSPLAFEYRVFWTAFTHRGQMFNRTAFLPTPSPILAK